jgi:probable F420-dependent oxidoreductase
MCNRTGGIFIPDMKFGIQFVTTRAQATPGVSKLAEELGYESVWFGEHLIFPAEMPNLSPFGPSERPYMPAETPLHDPFVVLSQIAAVTSRIKLGTGVYILPLRHPFGVARSVMSLDLFSGGRVLFGVAVGWVPDEFALAGQGWRDRGARLDEQIEVLRKLWTEPSPSHRGRFYSFPSVKFEPKPAQPGGPPILVCGEAEAVLRRAARLGDGWMGMQHTPESAAQRVQQLRALRAEYGRSGQFEVTVGAGSPSLDDVRRFEEASVDRLFLVLWRRTAEAEEGLRRFAGEVMAKL